MIVRKKKVVIEIAGGLGNQMFQYALYLKFKSLNYNCKLYYDPSQQLHNGFELNKVFDLNIDLATKLEVDALLDVRMEFFSKIKRRVRGRKALLYWEHDKDYTFKPFILEQRSPVYLQGCWLSEKYFNDIEDEVRKAFTFCKPSNEQNSRVFNQIISDVNSVSIHIRRGDYAKSNYHLNIDYKNYLVNAIECVNQKVSNPVLYVFSDDINYAKSLVKTFNVKNSNCLFIDWNKGENSFIDMQLMSLCKHNIIANSTFSWWGAWLNDNEQKTIICPAKWFSIDKLNSNSIIPESWIAI